MRTIDDFVAPEQEAGVGLALRDGTGRYLFFVAGTRHRCPPGLLFYAGIGGHREPGEDWVACAHREAGEEIGADVELLSATGTWLVPDAGSVQRVSLIDRPRPIALFEMRHLTGSPREGELYRLVIFNARLRGPLGRLAIDEVRGVLGLSPEQIMRGLDRRPSLAELLDEGASWVHGEQELDVATRVYPVGTAVALAYVLRRPARDGSGRG